LTVRLSGTKLALLLIDSSQAGESHEDRRRLPQTEIGSDPAMIRDYAQAVEAMGYTHILAFDSVLGANPDRPGGWDSPYTYRHAFHEPFVLFGFCAAVTRRIELATGVLVLPSARPRSSPSRPPRWTSSRAVGCASASESGGIQSSSRRSG